MFNFWSVLGVGLDTEAQHPSLSSTQFWRAPELPIGLAEGTAATALCSASLLAQSAPRTLHRRPCWEPPPKPPNPTLSLHLRIYFLVSQPRTDSGIKRSMFPSVRHSVQCGGQKQISLVQGCGGLCCRSNEPCSWRRIQKEERSGDRWCWQLPVLFPCPWTILPLYSWSTVFLSGYISFIVKYIFRFYSTLKVIK